MNISLMTHDSWIGCRFNGYVPEFPSIVQEVVLELPKATMVEMSSICLNHFKSQISQSSS